jgi:pimeloyl-ACP methyl ester carboxylesterase
VRIPRQLPVVAPALQMITSMVFPGASVPVSPAQLEATVRPGEELLEGRTSHGEPVAVIHRPPAGDRRGPGRYTLFLYGNAMTLADTAPIRAVLADGGAGVVCVDYLGYGGSKQADGGPPTEAGCYRAAHAALDLIEGKFGVTPGEADLVGWSLGSAVSVQVASKRPVRRLVLMSPFAGVGPFVLGRAHLNRTPVSRLGRLGPFAGEARTSRITAPTLLLSGADDTLTPTWMARALAAGISAPTELVVVPKTGHNDLFTRNEVWRRTLDFLAPA